MTFNENTFDEIKIRAKFFNDNEIVSLNITTDTVNKTCHGFRISVPSQQYINIIYAGGHRLSMLFELFLLETENYLNEYFDTANKYFG